MKKIFLILLFLFSISLFGQTTLTEWQVLNDTTKFNRALDSSTVVYSKARRFFYYLNHPITAVETFNYVYGQGWLTPVGGSTQIQGDWDQTNNAYLDFIKNKPSIPAAQIQSDWNQTNNAYSDFIKNKPSIPSYSVFDSYLAGLVPASGAYGYDYFVNGLGNWQYNLEYRAGYRTRMTFDLSYSNTYDVDNIDYHVLIDSISPSIPYTSSLVKMLIEDTTTGKLYRRSIPAGTTPPTAGYRIGISGTDINNTAYYTLQDSLSNSLTEAATATMTVMITPSGRLYYRTFPTTQNFWQRNTITLSPATANDILSVISTNPNPAWFESTTSNAEGVAAVTARAVTANAYQNTAIYAEAANGMGGNYDFNGYSGMLLQNDSSYFGNYLHLGSISAPTYKTDLLYNASHVLYWNGSAIGGGIAADSVPWKRNNTRGATWTRYGDKVGIGTTSPGVPLDVVGNIRFRQFGAGAATFDASGNISSVSDTTLKVVLGKYKTGLKALLNIDPIIYKWNKESGMETDSTYAGFSAQNVQSAIGNLGVGKNKEGKLSLQDRAIMATMLNAIKDQQKEIQELKVRIRVLEKKE